MHQHQMKKWKYYGILDKVNTKEIPIIQGDWNAKVGCDALRDFINFCGPSCNANTNERGLQLLEFASYNDMVIKKNIWSTRCPGAGRGIHPTEFIITKLITCWYKTV